MSDNNATSNNPTLQLCRANNDIATVMGALQVFAAYGDETYASLLTSCCDVLSDALSVIRGLISDQTSEADA